jgi:hypothetical protein
MAVTVVPIGWVDRSIFAGDASRIKTGGGVKVAL